MTTIQIILIVISALSGGFSIGCEFTDRKWYKWRDKYRESLDSMFDRLHKAKPGDPGFYQGEKIHFTNPPKKEGDD